LIFLSKHADLIEEASVVDESSSSELFMIFLKQVIYRKVMVLSAEPILLGRDSNNRNLMVCLIPFNIIPQYIQNFHPSPMI